MALQQHRIVRFLMILVGVILTIFIYSSYYSNLTTMTIPSTRIHQQQSSLIAVPTFNNNNNSNINTNNNDETSGLIRNPNSYFVVSDKQNLDKFQYNSGQEKMFNNSYSHQLLDDSSSTLTSSSAAAAAAISTNSSAIDLMKKTVISTTTTQNSSLFITMNNKLLQNITATGTATSGSSSVFSLNSQPQQPSNIQIIPASSSQSSAASSSIVLSPSIQPQSQKPSSSLSSLSSSSSQQQQQSTQQHTHQHGSIIDTTKGISTASIYESGHLDTNPLLCPNEGEALRLLIVITSAPSHREARLSIRQTWGHYGHRRDVSIAFILGRTQNQAIEDALTDENYMYGDLIRGRFIDSYNNLTLKTISSLEWIDKNCPQAIYVLKTDDDMFINVPKLLNFIDKHQNDKRIIFGRLAKKWKPIRNKKSKYYVSPGQFSLTIFPHFTTGPAYLISSDIIHDLYIKSLEQTYLKLEDVYTTGIVAQLLNVKRVHVNEFLNRRIPFNPCNIRKAISVHMIKSNEQFDLWKKLLDITTKCK